MKWHPWRIPARMRCHEDWWCCQHVDTPQCNSANDPHRRARRRFLDRELWNQLCLRPASGQGWILWPGERRRFRKRIAELHADTTIDPEVKKAFFTKEDSTKHWGPDGV